MVTNLVEIHQSTRKVNHLKKPLKKKKPTAYTKAKKTYDRWKKITEDDLAQSHHAMSRAIHYEQQSFLKPAQKKKALKMRDKWLKAKTAADKKYKRDKLSFDKAKNKLAPLKRIRDNHAAVKNKIAKHKHKFNIEGNCAIYRSDGHSQTVIFIAPTDTESESSSVNITSHPVDVGAPRSSYARVSTISKSVAGIITGTDRADAKRKYRQLAYWRDHGTELTYQGDFTSQHLIISELDRDWSQGWRDNLKVTINFQYVRAVYIETSTGKSANKKRSKASKTTQGNRNKNYTAITIKPGDTLLGLSRKYGKSVAWLQRVNKIKNPNKIYAGRTLYVSEKQKKIKRKMRVK